MPEDKIKIEFLESSDGGTAGRISWERLVEQMRNAGEFRPGEVVTRIVVTEDGLQYFVEKK